MRPLLQVLLIIILALSMACDVKTGKVGENGQGAGIVEGEPLDISLMGVYFRALASSDKRVEAEGKDFIAENFLPEYYKNIVKDPVKREKAIEQLPMSWYVTSMASTIYKDQVVKKASSDNTAQIVFLNAGYDSTPCRLKSLIKKIPVFEVDTPAILANKKKLLAEANILVPPNVQYVPVDYARDSMIDELVKAGYRKDKKTLFVFFGAVAYIPRESTIMILDFIKFYSPPGSSVCFDYMTAYELGIMSQKYDVYKGNGLMNKYYPDLKISYQFYEAREIESILNKEGFKIFDWIIGIKFDFEKRFPMLHSEYYNGGVSVFSNFVHARVL